MDPADTFRQEAKDLLDALEQALLDLEQNNDSQQLVDSAFRALHTLKGSGAMFGFDEVSDFVHEFETTFDHVRKGKAQTSPALIAVALKARDHVEKLINEPGIHAAAGEPILAALRQVVDAAGAAEATHASAGDRQPASNMPAAAAPGDGPAWRIVFRLPPDALAFGTNPSLLLDELRELGHCTVTALTDHLPPLDVMEPTRSYLGWEVVLVGECDRETIEDVFMFLRDGMDLTIERMDAAPSVETGAAHAASDRAAPEPAPKLAAPEPEPAAPPAQAGPTQARRPDTTQEAAAGAAERAGTSLRVAAERLDELMDRVGELVIAQSRLSQIADASGDLNLKAVAEELQRLASGLRDTTMSIRMVPIGSLFGRFRRMVHDLSRDLDKEVEFVTSGEETELDKTVVEKLADPLVHIIRNSIDHGLETAADRAAKGKSDKGTVRLSAVHAGAEVAISITDNGRGLDAQRIRAKAEEVGLLAPEAKVTEQELYQLLFHPGFSTAREVTALSGRGVGMDVVKRTIEGLRGSIDISSVPGKGTTVTLRLPLTLAIIEGMLVRVGNGRYTIPLSAVEECVELPRDLQQRTSDRHFLNIRGSLVPFLNLRELFKVKVPPDLYQKVVIVSSGESRVGLVVDQILGNNQTVIKSLSKLHSNIEGLSGATILGDGTVALILDVGQLLTFGQAFEEQVRKGRAA